MKENSIEEDIKIVENYLANSAINEIDSNFFKNGGWETVDLEIPESMQHILSDYKKVVNELKKYKNMYEAEHEIHKTRNEQLERKENSIQSALKLKNKFEELKLKLKDKDKEIKQLKEDIKKCMTKK